MGSFWRRLACPFFGVPLAWLGVALLAPAPAHAGCDYPTHIEHHPANHDGNLPIAPSSNSRQPSKPGSCTGPHCSRQPLAPSAPTSIESVKISEWGRLLPHLLLVPPQGDEWMQEPASTHPIHDPSSIYHPPRLAH